MVVPCWVVVFFVFDCLTVLVVGLFVLGFVCWRFGGVFWALGFLFFVLNGWLVGPDGGV